MLPHDEALRHYQWADAFVFTSLRDTTGTVVLEALGAGLPVVCLDHQGAHDVVTAECGVKIPVRTPRQVVEDLAQAITRLAQAPAQRQRLGQGAMERARQYLWSRQGERVAAVYEEVLSAPSGPVAPQVEGPSQVPEHRGPAAVPAALPFMRDTYNTTYGHLVKSRVAAWTACAARGLLRRRSGEGFGILMYHRVSVPTAGAAAPTWNVTPRQFRRQMAGLLARGRKPWPLSRVLAHHRAGQAIPPEVFVVTFDDGYECVYREAWPILRELGVPFSVFLPTAYLDTGHPFPFDDWPAAGSADVDPAAWRPLRAAQCAEMLAGGLLELGTHSHLHADFRGRPDELRCDLLRSLAVLGERFGVAEAAFAFPYGLADAGMALAAQQAGVTCSLTTESTLNAPGSDQFTWGRFIAENADTPATLAAKLDGWHSLLRRAWLRVRPGSRGAGVSAASWHNGNGGAKPPGIAGQISKVSGP
jgi:peptidoglycan/xylan/chitin deacetylase (PgdA/CDA1 family)